MNLTNIAFHRCFLPLKDVFSLFCFEGSLFFILLRINIKDIIKQYCFINCVIKDWRGLFNYLLTTNLQYSII